ncbi:MAG: 4Fe-4S dicluster domain-containing protein [Desulfovibrionaceae bacterium]|nr:4Fe-4S dicluster domain-containing protein [Desulfovibrionaceae bacterium]MDD4953003.1 4Fe-4S dicluster domain-containing protein [Desulfovibrionaceae bacterium]
MPKAFFIDTSRCTACRGCQLACKEWNGLEPNKTTQYQWGSHQNPQDLNPNNYKLVRFNEHLDKNNQVHWNFFPDQCRHCVYPPCKAVADSIVDNAIIQDKETGAVIFTPTTAKLSADDYQSIREACPYDIPRRDAVTGIMSKCTMCNSRLKNGMLPACVKACPTGTMNFGEREDMLQLADKRLKSLKKKYPKAMLADPKEVSVIYLLIDDPKFYHTKVVAEVNTEMNRKEFLAGLGRPFRQILEGLDQA